MEQQRSVVKWILENGGTVHYDYEFGDDEFVDESQPSVPKWLLDMLGVDYFSSVTEIDGSSTPVSDVTPLATLKNLKRLSLEGTKVSDATPLAGLTKLVFLSLSNTQVSDVTPLAGLTKLEGRDVLQWSADILNLTPEKEITHD